jgi:hypothetical protein
MSDLTESISARVNLVSFGRNRDDSFCSSDIRLLFSDCSNCCFRSEYRKLDGTSRGRIRSYGMIPALSENLPKRAASSASCFMVPGRNSKLHDNRRVHLEVFVMLRILRQPYAIFTSPERDRKTLTSLSIPLKIRYFGFMHPSSSIPPDRSLSSGFT